MNSNFNLFEEIAFQYILTLHGIKNCSSEAFKLAHNI